MTPGLGKSPALHPRWYRIEDPASRANEIASICEGLRADQLPRLKRYAYLTSLYEMRPIQALNAGSYDLVTLAADTKSYEDVYVPVARSLCDTAQADIAGRQRPKVQFQTSGSDWRTRRRAKKLDKFVEAALHLSQGPYTNGWELMVDAFLDAEITGSGVVKVYVDENGKIVLEKLLPGRLMVDAREAQNGEPLNYFETYLADEDMLVATYVDDPALELSPEEKDARRGAIAAAVAFDDRDNDERYGTTRLARSVRVYEALRMPMADGKPGRHSIAVQGVELFTEEWHRKSSPYVILRWSRERAGFWGTGLVEETRTIAQEYNRTLRWMQAKMVLSSGNRTYAKKDTVDPNDWAANDADTLVEYDGDTPPTDFRPNPLSQAEFEYTNLWRALQYESPGISPTSATATKEEGVDSAVAMRTMISVAAKRFSVKARYGYEYPFVALARAIVAAAAEFDGEVSVPMPDRQGQEIKWTDAAMDLDKVMIQMAPASALPNDPAGRQSTSQELFAMGVISKMTYLRLIDWPDLELEFLRQRSEWEYTESLIERYLDADDMKTAEYEPPDGYIVDKPGALIQVAQAYFQAKRERAPEFNLQLLRNYMLQLGQGIERGMQTPAAAPAPAPAAPAGAAGAPMGEAMTAPVV